MTRGNVLAVLVLGAVAACTDPKAGTLPTPSASTIASPSPSGTPASPATEVEEAVRRYYDALESAVHDPVGALKPLDDALHARCACRRILEVLREEARRGRHADYTFTIERLAVPDVTEATGTAHVTLAQSAGRLYDSSGNVVENIRPTRAQYFIEVVKTDGTWRIAKVTER